MGFSPSTGHQVTTSIFSNIVDAATGSFVESLTISGVPVATGTGGGGGGTTSRSIGIFTFDSVPDDTGSVFLEPYDIKATNDVWKRLVLVFNDTSSRLGFRGGFSVPADYSSGGEIVVTWTSTTTSGATEWDFDYRAVSVGDSFDQTGITESLNTSGTAPSSVHERVDTTLTLTSGVSANDEIEFELFRDGTDGGDDMAAAALVFRGMFRYTGG